MRDKVVQACYTGYEWSDKFLTLNRNIDLKKFEKIIKCYNNSSAVIVTFLSKEYLNVGKLWLKHFNKLKIKQLIIIAADIETSVYLDSVHVPNFLVEANEVYQSKSNFKSRTGFTNKGLAITNLKFPIVKHILKLGYDALLIDIDAIMLKPIPKKYFADVDVAFQRVVYFPDAIAKVWSFTACSGFVFFRSTKSVKALLNSAIRIQKKSYDDQIALNVALWKTNIKWQIIPQTLGLMERKKYFNDISNKNINGIGVKTGIKIKALSPKTFWRNDIVPFEISKAILFHPNSLKNSTDKIKLFRKHKLHSVQK